MFKFTTTTIVNSIGNGGSLGITEAKDPRFAGKTGVEGAADQIAQHPRMWVEDGKILRIAKHFIFKKDNIVKIYKRSYQNPVVFKVTFGKEALDNLVARLGKDAYEGTGRIELYIRLSGDNSSYYANDLVFKGKPFFVEFAIRKGDTAAKLAARIAKTARKYQNMVYEFPQLNVIADGESVVITGTDEYQVVKKAELQFYNEAHESYDCCALFGDFESAEDGVVVKQGHQGFGTFRQLVKDLRLPTAANTRWDAIQQDERPVLDGHYNEYIIQYCVNRGIMGGDAVGEVVKSLTSHVFYILDNGGDATTNPAKCFESLVDELNLEAGIVEIVDRDFDDATDTPKEADLEAAYDNGKNTRKLEDVAHGDVKDDNQATLSEPSRNLTDGDREGEQKFQEEVLNA